VRQCAYPTCRFRYPIADARSDRPLCPLCGSETIITHTWPGTQPEIADPATSLAPTRPVEVLLDNIRSTHNVGSILRTADGAGIRHVHLAGITPHGDNPKVAKTALGAENHVSWRYHRNGVDAILALQAQGKEIWALELTPAAVPLAQAVDAWPTQPATGELLPVVLVVGNEVTGIDPAIVDLADRVVAIPMHGSKRSLNVAVAFGVAAYFLTGR
jgi:tRNA G18 (ribose-2'-O)-methylase SpoU